MTKHLKAFTSVEKTEDEVKNEIYKYFLSNSRHKALIKNADDFVKVFSKSERIITDIQRFSLVNGKVFEKLSKGE